ncbi:MAG: hypothetical protein AMS15_05615 [Planctomycetes bacterium DG_23]|nr:MAG: hypothetical protein AMS15_05615 [Planctomycetes bacterium DG_23]
MSKVRLGFVGAGFMGQVAHLANYAQIPDCELVALAEKRPELRSLVAEHYNIPRQFESHREIAAEDDIDAVVSVLPYTLNKEVAITLLEAGKDVLIEKPMAQTLAEAEEMVEAAEKAGAKLMVGFMKRYDAGVELASQRLIELQKTKELGEATFARAHVFGGEWTCGQRQPITTDEPKADRPAQKCPGWLSEEYLRDFHHFLNIASHNINLLRFLLRRKIEVKAVEYGPTKLVVFDCGGFPAVLELGRISAHFWDEETKIYLEKGWMNVCTPPPLLKNIPAKVEIYRGGEKPAFEYACAEWSWAFKRQAEHFIHCILEDKEPRTSGRDSLDDMRLIEDIFRRLVSS